MAHNYEIKEKIVRAGNSRVFNSWHEYAGVTMEEFLDGLKWVCDDPMPNGKLSRQLACVPRPGAGMTDEQIEIWGPIEPYSTDTVGLHRLNRVYRKNGNFDGFYEDDGDAEPNRLRRRFNCRDGVASINALDRV